MRNGNALEKAAYWMVYDRIPATKLIILANIISFLLALFRLDWLVGPARFLPTADAVLSKPWTVFTYPLVGMMGAISLLFSCYWLWWAGGSLERSWGTRTFTIFFFGMSAITALGLLLGYSLIPMPFVAPIAGLWLPIAGVTIAFAMLNPEQQIMFFFVIPMKMKFLALIDVILVFVSFASQSPLLGFFALIGCAFSYWYVMKGRLLGYRTPRRESRNDNVIRIHNRGSITSRLNPFGWIKRYRERKRFKDFLNRSGFGE